MKDEFKPFPLYEFSGTEREIGRQMGEELREEIKGMIPYWYDVLGTVFPDSLESMIATTKKFEAPAKEYAPELWEEIVGIAEGSNMTTDEILFIQGGWELDSCGPAAFGCTDFACAGKATKDGKTIVGQNFDWYPNSPTTVMRIKPKNGPAFLTVTWPGHLAQVGMNENGIAFFINLLLSPKAAIGVPYAFICNKIMYQKNVGDAVRVIAQAKCASSFDYTIGTADGALINVETTPDKCGCVLPQTPGILTHSNHYLTHYLQRDCLNDQSSFPDSWLRQYRMHQLMEEQRGELSPEVMMQILQDHQDWPDSICRHCDMTGPVGEQFETIFSCVAVPEDGKLWTTAMPCRNPYKLYTL